MCAVALTSAAVQADKSKKAAAANEPTRLVLGEQDERREVAAAVAGLDVAKGLEATLFAAEPMLLSPTNIDVDHRGRVWICEVVNYRTRNGTRKDGDRILILEDTDGDGRADSRKVFYQGRDIDSAMGICILGKRVIVSCSPNVFVFTDEDGDEKADKKELLFTRTGEVGQEIGEVQRRERLGGMLRYYYRDAA
jgi:glucose/arabinose dehydrogenase